MEIMSPFVYYIELINSYYYARVSVILSFNLSLIVKVKQCYDNVASYHLLKLMGLIYSLVNEMTG